MIDYMIYNMKYYRKVLGQSPGVPKFNLLTEEYTKLIKISELLGWFPKFRK